MPPLWGILNKMAILFSIPPSPWGPLKHFGGPVQVFSGFIPGMGLTLIG